MVVEAHSLILKSQFSMLKHKYWEVIFLFAAYLKRKSSGRMTKKKTNSGALARQRTISTERPPLVVEVNPNFSG
jgi:hypothetical protein